MSAHLLGLDLGTTGAQAVLLSEAGHVVASASSDYPLSTPRPLWAEQDAGDWWQGSVSSIRRVLEAAGVPGSGVAGVGLTGQMHGLVLLDARDAVLRPAILWNDQRTGSQCQELTDRVGAATVIAHTGNPMLTGFTAPKLLWVQQEEPQLHERIRRVQLPKDHLRWRLTGEHATDVAEASGTALFDVRRRVWSEEMLRVAEVPREWLPEVFESPRICARISDAGARATGLAAGTPVVAGAGDQAAQAVGTGIVEEGLVSVTLGTSGVVFAASETYRAEPAGRLHAFCHARPGWWHLMGVMLSAGGSLRWYRDTLARDVPYEVLTDEAALAPPGSEGLLFLPYLSGERTPHPDPRARGAFVGLTLRHQRRHLTRAVLEGVACGLRDSLELMRDLGLEPREVRVTGGGARSMLWRQILADLLETPISVLPGTPGAAHGAALLAGVGVGVWPGLGEAARLLGSPAAVTTPDPDAVGVSQDTYGRYRALYPALRTLFQEMIS